jgi:predicted O-linked N-acetylglucosamine transferase (SPINDLY family)
VDVIPTGADDAAADFAAALRAHRDGDLEAAIAGYRRALGLAPSHHGALVNLGAALREAGRLAEALDACRHATEAAGAQAEPWFNLGNTLRDLRRGDDAMAAYRRALAVDPGLAGAHFRLAELLHEAGRTAEALPHWRATLERVPAHAPAWRRLVAAEEAAGRFEEATRLLETAVVGSPQDGWLLRRLGDRRRETGDLTAAGELYRRAVAADPDDAFAHDGLGAVLAGTGDLDLAEASFERARELQPRHAGIVFNLASLQSRRNRLGAAIALFREALALDPELEEATSGLIKTLARGGVCEEAVDLAAAAVARRPSCAAFHQARGYALTLQGRITEALSAFAAARSADPEPLLGHLNAAFSSLYSDALSAEEVTASHRELAGAVARHQPARPRPAPLRPDPERRLRVGYLAQDLCGHPVGFFIEPVLAHHDPAAVEVICYADVDRRDETTARLQALAPAWCEVTGLSPDRLADRIRADEVDVLVELGGHTGSHAATLLPRRPAPLQAVYIGYPCTTGVPAVDYLLTDDVVSPAEHAALYTERLAPIAGCFLCFHPPRVAPEVAPLPALLQRAVTFGCYANLPKLSGRAVALWSRVLHAVPGSRMILKAPGFDDPPTRERTWLRFAEHGIARERVPLFGLTTPRAPFLAEYGRVDVALDSLPYGGGTTTCEALWMGAPVVTLAGRHFFERMGASILGSAGLPELVAASEDDYVRIAVDLAADLPALAGLRAGLRKRLAASRLCDAPAHARALEAAYRRMWRELISSPA